MTSMKKGIAGRIIRWFKFKRLDRLLAKKEQLLEYRIASITLERQIDILRRDLEIL